MRLIDADALVQMPWVLPNRMTREMALECFRNIVNDAPTVDAEPVRHGRWEWDEVDFEYTCSNCRCSFDYTSMYGLFDHGFDNASFCPNCGAKMDKEE